MRRNPFRRAVIAAAMWRPGLSYLVAYALDRARNGIRGLLGSEPSTSPFWSRPTAFRERVLYEAVNHPTCAWPFPRVVAGPDPMSIHGPAVLVGFHVGAVIELCALFERLPEPRLALVAELPIPARPGTRTIDVEESGYGFAAKCAIDTLRAGGFVFSMADGLGNSSLAVDLCGRRVALPRGTFTVARLCGAPLLPVTARWQGAGIRIVAGDPIPPGDELGMAAALVRWFEAYLAECPVQMSDEYIQWATTALRSVDRAVTDRVPQRPVADLPRL